MHEQSRSLRHREKKELFITAENGDGTISEEFGSTPIHNKTDCVEIEEIQDCCYPPLDC